MDYSYYNRNSYQAEESADVSVLQFSFADPIRDVSIAKPYLFTIVSKFYCVQTWLDILIQTVRYINKYNPDIIPLLFEQYGIDNSQVSFSSSTIGLFASACRNPYSRPEILSYTGYDLNRPCKITDNLWIETKLTDKQRLELAIRFLSKCSIPLEEVVVHYIPQESSTDTHVNSSITLNSTSVDNSVFAGLAGLPVGRESTLYSYTPTISESVDTIMSSWDSITMALSQFSPAESTVDSSIVSDEIQIEPVQPVRAEVELKESDESKSAPGLETTELKTQAEEVESEPESTEAEDSESDESESAPAFETTKLEGQTESEPESTDKTKSQLKETLESVDSKLDSVLESATSNLNAVYESTVSELANVLIAKNIESKITVDSKEPETVLEVVKPEVEPESEPESEATESESTETESTEPESTESEVESKSAEPEPVFESTEPESAESESVPELVERNHVSFTKKLDLLTFICGFSLPLNLVESFLQNLKTPLANGVFSLLPIVIGERRFDVSIKATRLSVSGKHSCTFSWSINSPIAQYLQNRFQELYQFLKSGHTNFNEDIVDYITVVLKPEQDLCEFIIPQPNTPQPSANSSVSSPESKLAVEVDNTKPTNIQKENEKNTEQNQDTRENSSLLHFTLDESIPALEFSKPYSISIRGQSHSIKYWRCVITETLKYICDNQPQYIDRLFSEFGPDGKQCHLISHDGSGLTTPYQIISNLYVEINFGSIECIQKTCRFLQYCDLQPSDVSIYYVANKEKKNNSSSENIQPQLVQQNKNNVEPQNTVECTSNKDIDIKSCCSFFTKCVDLTLYTHHIINVPLRCQEAFLQHLSSRPNAGSSSNVAATMILNRTRYTVRFKYSKQNPESATSIVRFRIGDEIIHKLQSLLPTSYRQLQNDRMSQCCITDYVTIACGTQPDEFDLIINASEEQLAQLAQREGQKQPVSDSKPQSAKSDISETPRSAIATSWTHNRDNTDNIRYNTVNPVQVNESADSDTKKFLDVIEEKYVDGLTFNPTCKSLLENAVGQSCTSIIENQLKQFLFKRSDGVYLLPKTIVPSSLISSMKEFVTSQIATNGSVAVSRIYDQFHNQIIKLDANRKDVFRFLEQYFFPQMSDTVKVVGQKNSSVELQLCLPISVSEGEFYELLSDMLYDKLKEHSDQITLAEFLNQFPYLNGSILKQALESDNIEVIELKSNEGQAYKALEALNLPDDFGEFLTQVISDIEGRGDSPTISSIATKLGEQYVSPDFGYDNNETAFRQTFGLDTDSAFKKVISICYQGDEHVWKYKTFTPTNRYNKQTNLFDDFIKQNPNLDIFHENTFFEFAEKNRGYSNRYALIQTWLHNHCIRLAVDRWISIKAFYKHSTFDSQIEQVIRDRLLKELGNKPFLPIGTISQSFLDELPEIYINNKACYWNPYLLESISLHVVKNLRIVNDEPSPYIVTAMLVPQNADITDDVVNYVLTCYHNSGYKPKSVEEVGEILKKNQVRMCLRQTVIKTIKKVWNYL